MEEPCPLAGAVALVHLEGMQDVPLSPTLSPLRGAREEPCPLADAIALVHVEGLHDRV